MTTLVDAGLLADLRRFGAGDISACFSCGNCTAICPLSENDATFPRRIIRYAQLGMKEALLSSKELWTCYHCGECSETCPTQADPGEFMAAARRYAVASYDPTGLGRRLATSAPFTLGFMGLLVALMAAFMYSASHSPVGQTSLAFFEFVPAPLIHDLGIAVMALWALAAVAGLVRMVRHVFGGGDVPIPSLPRAIRAVCYAVVEESLGQARYRRECTEDAEAREDRPLYRRRWFVHGAIMWGFIGLLAATILDYLLELVGIKATGTPVPLWYPVRLLGTLAGLSLMYGTSVVFVRRFRATEPSYASSSVSDWSFLALLWVTGLTGFVIELALYLPDAPPWAYPVFLLHVAVAMTLVLSMPFGKFAHALYRPVALGAFRLRSLDADPGSPS
ncbi:MAG: 4Fe-4S dicluster domain-containing protein [Candidatus Limnocylindrales bacterium]